MSQIPPSGGAGYTQQPEQQVPNYDNYEEQAPPGVAPGPAPGPAAGRKKRRDYAGQAYEFGAGGNAPATPAGPGGPVPGTSISGYSTQADAAGYAQGGYQQNPAAVQPGATPLYGQQDGLGGYQPPGSSYPTQTQSSVPAMTQQFSQMDMSQKPQPQQNAHGRPPALNQLYPVDLQNQPLNVAEMDFPPPPAILPPNVSTLQKKKSLTDLP